MYRSMYEGTKYQGKNHNTLVALRAEHHDEADKLTRNAVERGKDLTGAELEQFNAHIQEIKDIDNLLAKDAQLLAQAKARFGMPSAPGQANESSWIDPRSGQPVAVLSPEQRLVDLVDPLAYGEPLSLGKYLRGIVTGKWNGAQSEFQAMSESSLGGGGYLLPAPLSSAIIDKVRNASVLIRAGARTIPMESNTLAMARVAGDVTPAWHTEAAAITPSDMSFEKVTFTAQTLVALATLSVELFEDTSVDAIVADAIAKVLAIELDRAGLRGSGTAPEPKGLRNQTGVTVDSSTFTTNGSLITASAPTGAVAWDWLAKQISALWGVNESPNAAIYSARTAGELDLLRATTGAVLPPPGSVANLQLLYTNSIPNNLTQGSSNTCSEAYVGDFNQAMIGMRTGLVTEVSRYANAGATSLFSTMQVGIRCYLRADFQLARPGAFRVVTGIL